MGNLICMCSSNSRAKSDSRIADCSTWYPQPGQHISIRTFRELSLAPMSRHILRRTETSSTGANSRSIDDQREEANNQ
ncbi:C4 [Jatropha mosaic Nigeria virus]|uniref:C4 n=1 Tax=Jatropha mosaic Nigeria virus TaxID=1213406 RepID=I7A6R0_9GEMI|nr:C4 [Jatropha mosaic Nigeria virus]AFO38437.1 C4 [Jatropha mosaic Nigeria virus]